MIETAPATAPQPHDTPDTPPKPEDPPPRRSPRRWRIVACIVLLVMLIGSAISYLLIVHAIRSHLEALIRDNLHAELQGESISWRPPYGIIVRHARIVRADGRGQQVKLFHADRIDLKLAGLPYSGTPIIIETLLAQGPSLHLGNAAEEKHPAPPPAVAGPPAKWSDSLKIRHLQIRDGSFFYQDRGEPTAPALAVQNINLTASPPASADAAQPFEVYARDGSTDLHVRGSIQPDALVVAIDAIALNVHLDPAAPTDNLPKPLSDLAKRYGIAGDLTLTGKGQIPCHTPPRSTFDGTLEVSNASAAWPGAPVPLEKAHIKLSCDSEKAPAIQPISPIPPGLHATLVACDALYGGVALHLDSGDFREDAAAGAWKLTQLAGHVAGVAGRVASTTSPTSNPADEPPLRGRIDFTATASGPLHGPTGALLPDENSLPPSVLRGRAGEGTSIAALPSTQLPPYPPPEYRGRESNSRATGFRYEVLAFPRDLSLKIKSFPLPIDHIDGGQIRIDNAAASLRDMIADYGGDRIILNSARIPIPDQISQLWKLETRIEEIAATVNLHQPGPVYPQGIQGTLEGLHPQGTFAIGNGRMTLNYREPQSGKPKPKDDFAFDISADGTPSLTVTNRRIPITGIRGNAALDNLGIVVGIDDMKNNIIQGRCMGGEVSLHMKIRTASKSEPAYFQGEAWARNINVATLCNVTGIRDGQVSKAGGKGYLHATFSLDGKGGKQSPAPPGQTLRAAGEAEILGADYWEDPIMRVIAGDIQSHSHSGHGKKEPGVCDAAAVFHIANRVVTLDPAAVSSPSLGVQGTGTITFDKQLDLQVVATPIGDLKTAIEKASPNIVGEVAGDIVGAVQGALRSATGSLLYQYRITGPATNPQKQTIAAPVLSDAGALLFGRMAEQRDGELLKHVQAGATATQHVPTSRPVTLSGKGREK